MADEDRIEREDGAAAEASAAEAAETTETPPAASAQPVDVPAAPSSEAAPERAEAEPSRPKRGPRPKALRAPKAARERGVYRREPPPEKQPGRRKERRGVVVSSAADKTITVRVDSAKPHPKYLKIVRRSRKLHAHDERNQAKVGDVVRIAECRPLSKTKRWRLVEIVEVAR